MPKDPRPLFADDRAGVNVSMGILFLSGEAD